MTLVHALCLLMPTLAPADDWRSLIEQALDQPTELNIQNRPLTEAFDEIVGNTGVQVSVSEETLALLPYGRNTRMNVRIRNMSLREGLEQMTLPLGLRFEVTERGIVLVVEEAVRGVDGVKEISAVANEGVGLVNAELFEGVDQQKVYQEIQQEISRITTFPEEAEEPEVVLAVQWHEVLTVELYGDVGEWALREVAEQVRDRLLLNPQITQVKLKGARNYEIQAEVPKANLRAYGLTLDGIARTIAATAVESHSSASTFCGTNT